MLEIQVQSLGWKEPLEKGMATHSSVLAWRIPCTREFDGVTKSGTRLSEFVFANPKRLSYSSPYPLLFGNHKFAFYICESVSVL